MFVPSMFKNEDIHEVKDFIRSNSFGILITAHNKIMGTHIPLELEEDKHGEEVIYGHIAKANPQVHHLNHEDEVMVIFNGPHAYISSSWYDHENVPTWNYTAVHVYGKIQILEEEELLYSLGKLVDKYEAKMKNPVSVSQLSARTMRQTKGIVGFKIKINEVQAAYKLSQNRNDQDYKNIVEELKESDHHLDNELGELMHVRRKK